MNDIPSYDIFSNFSSIAIGPTVSLKVYSKCDCANVVLITFQWCAWSDDGRNHSCWINIWGCVTKGDDIHSSLTVPIIICGPYGGVLESYYKESVQYGIESNEMYSHEMPTF